MTNEELMEIQSCLLSLEQYFMTVLEKAMVLHQVGTYMNDPMMSIHAKTTQSGVIGLLESMDNMRERAAILAGTTRITVEDLDKPNLQLLKGGVDNDEKSL